MKWLLRIAFAKKERLFLIVCAAFAMVLATLSSQAEMLSLGFLNPKSIDVFEIFSPTDRDQLTKQQLDRRWHELDPHNHGVLTRDDLECKAGQEGTKGFLNALIFRLRASFEAQGGGLRLIILFAIVSFIRAICSFSQSYLNGRIYLQVWQELCQSYFDKLQQMPLKYHNRQSRGKLVTRISHDAAACAAAVNSLMTNYWQTPLLVFSSLGYLYYMSPALFGLVLIELPFLGALIFFFTKKIRKIVRQTQSQREDNSSLLIEFLSGVEAIKMFAAEKFTSLRYRVANDQMIKLEMRALSYHLTLRPLVHFACTLFFVGIIMWGVSRTHIQIGELLSYCGLIYLIYEQVKKIADENASIQKGVVAAERLFELIDAKLDISDLPNALILSPFSRDVTFRNVGFRYEDEGPWALRHLNFSIKKGSFAAFVGSTGAGKSTLIQLIARLYDAEEGSVEIDGIDVRNIEQRSLREQIAFVPQRPFLLSDTIAANVAFGRDVSQQRIEWACQRAHADNFIKSLPDGYQTRLSEFGNSLSGGQQQRLAIARALVAQAPILILDEATSALDALTESQIRATLRQLRGSVTLILIAHRLSTIEDADQIFFLQNGELLSSGTRADLIKSCPPFRMMWEAMMLGDRAE